MHDVIVDRNIMEKTLALALQQKDLKIGHVLCISLTPITFCVSR